MSSDRGLYLGASTRRRTFGAIATIAEHPGMPVDQWYSLYYRTFRTVWPADH